MILTRTPGIKKDSWYRQGLMVWTKTHGIDNTHVIGLDSCYRFGTPESRKYERAECYPYAGFCCCYLSDIFLVAISLPWVRGDNSLNKCSRFIQQLFPSISVAQMSQPYLIHMENTLRFLLKIVIYFNRYKNTGIAD